MRDKDSKKYTDNNRIERLHLRNDRNQTNRWSYSQGFFNTHLPKKIQNIVATKPNILPNPRSFKTTYNLPPHCWNNK